MGRRKLPPPAGSTVYELTELGRGLEEPLLGLARWGLWTLRLPSPHPEFRPLWAAAGMKILFRPEAATGVHETYELRIACEVFHARVDDGAIEIRPGPAEKPALVLSTDSDTWLAMGSGTISPTEARRAGKLKLDGNPAAAARFTQMFPAPVPAASAPNLPIV